jgi:thiamine biosynthesis protein ThiS
MRITLNGKNLEVQSQTLAELVLELGFAPESLVVEKNRELIKKERWVETRLHDGDILELLNFVGGG